MSFAIFSAFLSSEQLHTSCISKLFSRSSIGRSFNESRVKFAGTVYLFIISVYYIAASALWFRIVVYHFRVSRRRQEPAWSGALGLSVFVLYHFPLMNFCNEYPRGRICQIVRRARNYFQSFVSSVFNWRWLLKFMRLAMLIFMLLFFPIILSAFRLSFIHILQFVTRLFRIIIYIVSYLNEIFIFFAKLDIFYVTFMHAIL